MEIRILTTALTVVCGLSLAPVASAAPVSVDCPDSLGRFVTLTTDPGTATCLLGVPGNLSGNADGVQDVFISAFGSDGWIILDKSDGTGTPEDGALTGVPVGLQSGLSGSFSIGDLSGTYERLAIGFKSGGNQNQERTAFVFELPTGVTSGLWQFSADLQNALSHANLYGIPGQTTTPIPLPAAAWMLLSALGGLGVLGWRRKSVA